MYIFSCIPHSAAAAAPRCASLCSCSIIYMYIAKILHKESFLHRNRTLFLLLSPIESLKTIEFEKLEALSDLVFLLLLGLANSKIWDSIMCVSVTTV